MRSAGGFLAAGLGCSTDCPGPTEVQIGVGATAMARPTGWELPMNRRQMILATGAAGALLAVSAHAGPKITSDTLPGANFAGYKTFGWVDTRPPSGMDPVAYGRIMQDVESGLTAKGYTKSDTPDLGLMLSLGAQNKTQVNTFGYFGRQLDVYQYTEGKLSLDAFDVKTKQAVWHGQADATIHPDKPDPGKIDSAVDKLMVKFPASGGG
jgi:hypothetical protein